MKSSCHFIFAFWTAMITLAVAEPKSKPPPTNLKMNNGVQFHSDNSTLHLANGENSDVPLMYRSMLQNSTPGVSPKPSNGLAERSTSGFNFTWPTKIDSFSSQSPKLKNDKSSASDSDQPNWQSPKTPGPSTGGSNEKNSQMPQFFETPAVPDKDTSGSSVPKKGVAFWPRDLSHPSSTSLQTKHKPRPKERVVARVVHEEYDHYETTESAVYYGSDIDDPEKEWKQPSIDDPEKEWKQPSIDDDFPTAQSTNEIQNRANGSFANYMSRSQHKTPELNIGRSQVDRKRATSEFSPREDFTTNIGGKSAFKFPEGPREPEPPIFVAGSDFRIPGRKSSRPEFHGERTKPHIPSIALAPGMADESTSNIIKDLILRKNKGRPLGDTTRNSPFDSEDRRRWGQDSQDRIKEYRNKMMSKRRGNHQTNPLPSKNYVRMPIHGPGSSSESFKNQDRFAQMNNKNGPVPSSSQPWSSLSSAQRRVRLSTRLAELMAKNRLERRTRLFGAEKAEGIRKPVEMEIKKEDTVNNVKL